MLHRVLSFLTSFRCSLFGHRYAHARTLRGRRALLCIRCGEQYGS